MNRFGMKSLDAFTAKLPEDVKSILQTLLLSLAAAGGAVLFMELINTLFSLLYVRSSSLPKHQFIILSFIFMMTSSFIVSLLLRKVPSAAGSGIPQVKAAYWKELGYIPFKSVIVKFIAAIVSIGGGASLGREGPTIFLGSGIASFLSGFTGSPKRQRRAATAIGSSAGLAAAFNTPLAAITFCIEELINDLNTRYLGRVVLASLFGAMTVYALVGRQPSFELPDVSAGSLLNYALIPLVALIGSLLGIVFQKATLSIRLRTRRQRRIPVWIMPCIGALLTWIIANAVFLSTGKIGIFGLGYHDLSATLVGNSVWWIAGISVIGKLAATIASYGFGGCGGIFSPTLFIGGMAGALVSGVAGIWFPTSGSDHVILSTVGMSACLGAVIRAPLTSTLIVFEMTHQFEIVPGLMLSAVISQLAVRVAGIRHNFYDELLLQDGHELIKIKPPRDLQSWHNLSVSHIMSTKPAVIDSLDQETLRAALLSFPFRVFPYLDEGRLSGLLTRDSIQRALAEKSDPPVFPPCKVDLHASVKEASDAFIGSPHGFLVIVDPARSSIAGILTLHDLLRAQTAVTE